jgi:predicted esterase YcpF (UPF0227 family)
VFLYLHGFNSSPQSFKARLLDARLRAWGRASELLTPQLPHRPAQAIASLEAILAAQDPQAITLVGSSLGGYYATWLAERYGLRAVLVNPALRPYELLAGFVGEQVNLYTGERYRLTLEHVAELRALEVEAVTPQRYLLLVAMGDEILDSRRALERYRGAQTIVDPAGDHGFSDFGRHLDAILDFAAAWPKAPGSP